MKRIISTAALLVLAASSVAFGAQLNLEAQVTYKLGTADSSNALVPLSLATETTEIRFRGSEKNAWSLNLDTALGPATTLNLKRPKFYGQLITSTRTFQVWGGAYDLGAGKSDPNNLLVMGSAGVETFAYDLIDAAVPAGDINVRTTWDVAGVALTTDLHQKSNLQTNFSVYGDKTVGAVKLGAIARVGVRGKNIPGSTTAVGFAETDLAGVKVAGSLGFRYNKDNVNDDFMDGFKNGLAYGVSATKELAVGASQIVGSYIARQSEYYDKDGLDAGYQSGKDGFANTYNAKGTAEGSVLKLVGTWRGGEVNAKLNPVTMFNAGSESTLVSLKAPAYQGIIRYSKDASDNAETIIAARAGAPFIENTFWGIVEAKMTMDEDGTGAIAGKQEDSRLDITSRLRYNLDGVGMPSWFALGKIAILRNPSANQATLGVELWYNKGKVRIINGIESISGTAYATGAKSSIYSQFQLLF